MKRDKLDMPLILQTATEFVDQHGLEALTLAALAKLLNIRPPSLYNHVDGLPGLRQRLAIHGLSRINEALTRAAVGRARDEAVHAMADAYVQFVRDHPGLYEATVRAPDWGKAETHRIAEEPVKLTVQVLKPYGLEGDDATHAVRGLHSILHGFASLEQTGNFNMPVNPDESLHLLIDYFLAGIRSRHETTGTDL